MVRGEVGGEKRTVTCVSSLGASCREAGLTVKWLQLAENVNLMCRGMFPAFLNGTSRLMTRPAMQESERAWSDLGT